MSYCKSLLSDRFHSVLRIHSETIRSLLEMEIHCPRDLLRLSVTDVKDIMESFIAFACEYHEFALSCPHSPNNQAATNLT